MKTLNEVVKSDVEFNVNQSGKAGAAAVVPDVRHGVDMERLAAALADHAQAVKDREAHRATLTTLHHRTAELDAAIMDIEAMLSDKPDVEMDISAIKRFADDQQSYRNQIAALVGVRTGIEKQIKSMDERVITCAIQDANGGIWRTLYEGLLTAIDKEPLEQLFVAGSMIGKPERGIVSDLALSDDTRRLEAMIKQFKIPMGV